MLAPPSFGRASHYGAGRRQLEPYQLALTVEQKGAGHLAGELHPGAAVRGLPPGGEGDPA